VHHPRRKAPRMRSLLTGTASRASALLSSLLSALLSALLSRRSHSPLARTREMRHPYLDVIHIWTPIVCVSAPLRAPSSHWHIPPHLCFYTPRRALLSIPPRPHRHGPAMKPLSAATSASGHTSSGASGADGRHRSRSQVSAAKGDAAPVTQPGVTQPRATPRRSCSHRRGLVLTSRLLSAQTTRGRHARPTPRMKQASSLCLSLSAASNVTAPVPPSRSRHDLGAINLPRNRPPPPSTVHVPLCRTCRQAFAGTVMVGRSPGRCVAEVCGRGVWPRSAPPVHRRTSHPPPSTPYPSTGDRATPYPSTGDRAVTRPTYATSSARVSRGRGSTAPGMRWASRVQAPPSRQC